MNTANIKKYAPKARNNFIAAVTKQAARYGITAKGTEPMEQRGDIALIGENAFPKAIAPARKALERMVAQMGFAQAMEQAAYSWFNRLCAIRYMEIHDFLDHGRRVLSTANGDAGTPQILDDCLDISLPGLDSQQVAELKLHGNKDEELYRELLLAQCHALHQAMPFLFEAVDDATELLLPDNLTKTDSLIRELVSAIPEDDWQDVEIIGWLYQFYISEKKDQVIGKVVKSEDIPAATQLFTPNWIVQYLVQNSVGRQWLQTYPDSPLRNQMPYFIEPGEQPPEVQAQLAETVPDAIDPENIKVLDPACGSGHILVEAYKILKAIYEERGYRSRDIPQQILKHNLFGLDIDDRAGQLAGFALMMLAREDDRRLFGRVAEGGVTLNVLSLKETSYLDLPQVWQDLNLSGDWQQGSSQSLFESEQADLSSASADERYQLLQRTLERFKEAKTFGSLIEVPEEDAAPLKMLVDQLEQLARTGDVMQKPAAEMLVPYVRQAWILAQRYDAVLANPPYMGTRNMPSILKVYSKENYPLASHDLYAVFMVRAFELLKCSGLNAQVRMHSWMFLGAYRKLREYLISKKTIVCLAHLGARAFREISGEVVQTEVSIISNQLVDGYVGSYDRATDLPGEKKSLVFFDKSRSSYTSSQKEFVKIPGSPIAYWLSEDVKSLFANCSLAKDLSVSRKGMVTANNERYVRYWFEVSFNSIGFNFSSNIEASTSNYKWFPYLKGGRFRRWYGNHEFVVLWENGGDDIRNRMHPKENRVHATNFNLDYIFKSGITWSDIAVDRLAFRLVPGGFIFDAKSPMAFDFNAPNVALASLNSSLTGYVSKVINPTVSFQVGNYDSLPIMNFGYLENSRNIVERLVDISKFDWDCFETSWDFSSSPLLYNLRPSLSESWEVWRKTSRDLVEEAHGLEKKNDAIAASFLNESVSIIDPFPLDYVTLDLNPSYRYGEPDSEERFQSDSIADLVSYAVGCVLGRFSLNREGVIYAGGAKHELADCVSAGLFSEFPADEDAILPLTDQEWFPDDATNRFRQFILTVWGEESLQENLDFVAESLCLHAIKAKRGESALDTIRRYLSTQFYKDHLRTYKKRPIYWLFSSGKHKAFECLVYLHRYNEGTLARMRTEYVIPLSAKLNAYAEKLEQDKEVSTSAAETKRLEKEITTLHKQQAELAEFDDKLRHYADQRIRLDLDDGVKVNYGKFGDLLAEVKAVTGQKP